MQAFAEVIKAVMEATSLDAFISPITYVKDSNDSMKAFMEAFVQVTSMEAFVEAFVEAPVEVASVEAFKCNIFSMEALMEDDGSFS